MKLNNVLPLVGSYQPHLSNSTYSITYFFYVAGHVWPKFYTYAKKDSLTHGFASILFRNLLLYSRILYGAFNKHESNDK